MEKPTYDVIGNEPDKIRKIEEKVSEKVVNTCVYTLRNEDETMGNLLMETLLKDDKVRFTTFLKKRRLENNITVTIQTNNKNYTPRTALTQALEKIIEDCTQLKREFLSHI